MGHSLGGLIIRAALPHLEEYKEKMHSYFSLSTPHLGYMYTSSKIIEAGIWILQKWKKSHCLQQLSMNDAKNVEESFLYKLSLSKVYNFRNFVNYFEKGKLMYKIFFFGVRDLDGSKTCSSSVLSKIIMPLLTQQG